MLQLSDTALEERAQLTALLVEQISTITDEEIEFIAEADLLASARENQKQAAALRTVVFKRKCMMTEKHVWYPMEVLGLIADSTEEHLDRCFEIATALLMIYAMHDDDSEGMMSWRWQEIGRGYWETDPAFRPLLLGGFIWLSENATDWEYMQDTNKAPSIPKREDVKAMFDAQQATAAPES